MEVGVARRQRYLGPKYFAYLSISLRRWWCLWCSFINRRTSGIIKWSLTAANQSAAWRAWCINVSPSSGTTNAIRNRYWRLCGRRLRILREIGLNERKGREGLNGGLNLILKGAKTMNGNGTLLSKFRLC